jgi:hypothetical protein
MQLVVQTGPDAGKVFNLDRPVLVMGRQMGNDVLLNDTQVSRRHVQFEVRGGQVFVIDLGSSNGTTLNGQRLLPNEARLVKPGDLIRLGLTSLTVQDSAPGFYPVQPSPNYQPQPQTPVYPNPSPPLANNNYYNQPQPVQAAPYYPQPASVYPPAPAKPKAKRGGLIVVGLVVFGVLLVGLIVLLGSMADKSTTTTRTTVGPVNGQSTALPAVTFAPTATVPRGQTGTNPPPPAPVGQKLAPDPARSGGANSNPAAISPLLLQGG